MVQIFFAPHFSRHQPVRPMEVQAATVCEALEVVFRDVPGLKGYVLDDQGALRQHVMIFLDDELICDRQRLSDAVRPTSEIYVMQALSGG